MARIRRRPKSQQSTDPRAPCPLSHSDGEDNIRDKGLEGDRTTARRRRGLPSTNRRCEVPRGQRQHIYATAKACRAGAGNRNAARGGVGANSNPCRDVTKHNFTHEYADKDPIRDSHPGRAASRTQMTPYGTNTAIEIGKMYSARKVYRARRDDVRKQAGASSIYTKRQTQIA